MADPDPDEDLKFVHDARSTLTAIQGAFELMLLSDLTARNRRLAQAGQTAAQKLEGLLDAFAADEMGRIGHAPDDVPRAG